MRSHALAGGCQPRGEPAALAAGCHNNQEHDGACPFPPLLGRRTDIAVVAASTTARGGYGPRPRTQAAHSGHKPCFRWAHVPMPYGSAPDELTMTRL